MLSLPTPVSRAGGERGGHGTETIRGLPSLPWGDPSSHSPPNPQQVTHCSIMQHNAATEQSQGNVLSADIMAAKCQV